MKSGKIIVGGKAMSLAEYNKWRKEQDLNEKA